MKPRQPPANWNDKLRANDAAQQHYAVLTDKPTPERWLNHVAPKRTRAPSTLPTEHQEQVAVIHFWRHACHTYKLPEFSLFAVANGSNRDHITGALLKAEGVRPGIPDLMLTARKQEYAGLFIEMKRINTYATPEQKTIGAYLIEAGYCWKVCRGADSAIETIREYLKP